jgi:hypothetical protein
MSNNSNVRQETYLERDKQLLAKLIHQFDSGKTLFSSKRDGGTRERNSRYVLNIIIYMLTNFF